VTTKRRAAFLDRDGVLNRALIRDNRAYAPLSLNDFHLYEGVERDVARLKAQGLVCVVFTNQPEVARKTLDPDILKSMHDRLRAAVDVDDVYVCPHDPDDGCLCHKPKPGMLLAAAERWSIDLARSFVVGDRWRDIGAGKAANCYTVLIDRPYSECSSADARVHDLTEAVDAILARLER
jgi:D-glycero-D-manno-heptose 1,7-bisphosphate phosphatase